MTGAHRGHRGWLTLGITMAAALFAGCSTTVSTKPDAPAVAQVDDRSQPPWSLPDDVAAQVADAGLDLGPMGTAEHYHPHLRIVIDGQDVAVPAGVGVDPRTGAMSALHTHESDGTLHVEAHTIGETFTLGQLFTQWGVELTNTQIGGVAAPKGQRLRVFSNGGPVDGNLADLRLEPEQQILVELDRGEGKVEAIR